MQEKIKEMARAIDELLVEKPKETTKHAMNVATYLFDRGYRKQEWISVEVNGKNYGQVYYQHKDCKVNETQIFPSPYHFCPNCGAKMKGAENEKI